MFLNPHTIIAFFLLTFTSPILSTPLAQTDLSDSDLDLDLSLANANAAGAKNPQWILKGFSTFAGKGTTSCGKPSAQDKGRTRQKCMNLGLPPLTGYDFDGKGKWKLCVWASNSCDGLQDEVGGGKRNCKRLKAAGGQSISVIPGKEKC